MQDPKFWVPDTQQTPKCTAHCLAIWSPAQQEALPSSRLTSRGLSVAEQNQAALGMRNMPAPPLVTSSHISLEPKEVTLPKDKTISKDNTHRVGEVHNPIYGMNKLLHQREEKLGMKSSQSSIVKSSSKGLSFFKIKEKYENANKYLGFFLKRVHGYKIISSKNTASILVYRYLEDSYSQDIRKELTLSQC